MMRRRDFLTVVSSAALGVSCATLKRSDGARRPNLVYAFSDEHRWQSMSFTETPQVQTPVMAKMAATGATFDYCISNYPVCSPHRAMLMTGRWPFQTGMIDNNLELSPDEPTLGKVFQRAGYHTGYIGKWHLGDTTDARPFGFDTSLLWSNLGDHQEGAVFFPTDGPPQTTTGYNATLMTDQAVSYMEAHRDEPFFLMVSLHPPHSRFTDPPDDTKALYPEGSLPYRPNVPATAATETPDAPIWEKNAWPHYQGYHGHITAVDRELGRVLDAIDRLGIADNTYVVYSSDHGSMMGSHGLGSKRQPYEESIRVPLLAVGPEIPSGNRREELFGTIDVFPTLCGLAGIDIPSTCEGLDFSGNLRGNRGPDPKSQFIMHIAKNNASGGQEHPAPIFRGVRTRRHTYAIGERGDWGLFDNTRDPYQLKNLIDAPELEDLRRELRDEVCQWVKRANDPWQC